MILDWWRALLPSLYAVANLLVLLKLATRPSGPKRERRPSGLRWQLRRAAARLRRRVPPGPVCAFRSLAVESAARPVIAARYGTGAPRMRPLLGKTNALWMQDEYGRVRRSSYTVVGPAAIALPAVVGAFIVLLLLVVSV